MALSETTKKRIEGLIGSDRVVVFMKGNRRTPQCGFSAQVVQILDAHLPVYTTVDVLQDPEVRQGIKDFTNWPTVPQVYVNGEFVGGCDILTELYQSGELEGVLAASGS
jgi:monothiol glutaredoxin